MESPTLAIRHPSGAETRVIRAAVVTAPGEVRVEERPLPEPAAGQVRVRLEGCGVCGSNLPTWEGREWFDYPLESGSPGHEGWGVVDAVGDDVENVESGDRVAVLSHNAFAEYDIAAHDQIVRLPDWLHGRPFPGEPLGCAMNVFRRCDIRSGDSVAVIGIGFLGALLTQLVASAGARVIAISRRPFSLEVARAAGADEVVVMDDQHEIIDQVKELTGGRLCERVIEATGMQWPLDLAGELTAERGRLVIAGYHQDGLRKVNVQLWNWRGLDVINAHERDPAMYTQGICDAIAAIEHGRLDPFPLFTHTVPLDDLGTGLELLRDRPDGFVKALIRTDA